MRINKYIAQATGLSRRVADKAIEQNHVLINGKPPQMGADVISSDKVTLNGKPISLPSTSQTILVNKPAGYICSRDGQGAKTIYDLLPPALRSLKLVGRLDKDSAGLILLSSDGDLANKLTHPKFQKQKQYEVMLDKPLTADDRQAIAKGVPLEDGPSRLQLQMLDNPRLWQVTMHEGRNRQIRRTFSQQGYQVSRLVRIQFGPYSLSQLSDKLFIHL